MTLSRRATKLSIPIALAIVALALLGTTAPVRGGQIEWDKYLFIPYIDPWGTLARGLDAIAEENREERDRREWERPRREREEAARETQRVREFMRLGMDATPPSTAVVVGGAYGASIRDSGGTFRDSAGFFPAGTQAATSRTTVAGGWLAGYIDASRAFDRANQSLFLGAFVDVRHISTRYGTSPDLLAAGIQSAGLADHNVTQPGLFFRYGLNSIYVQGIASGIFARSDIVNNQTVGRGSFDSHGYVADLAIGNIFVLWDSTPYQSASRIVTKAPSVTSPSPYVVGLDLSAHLGYLSGRSDGFTDTSGYVTGIARTHFGDIGARAKLFATFVNGSVLWTPYVSATLDQRLGYSSNVDVPSAADTFIYSSANTFWGAELGMSGTHASGVKFGASAFYRGSSDLNAFGGQAFLKIPLAMLGSPPR